MNHTDELIGIIEKVVFHNSDNGFSVCRLQSKEKELITVTGSLPALHPGQQVTLSGSWAMHPKFGKQFHANTCTATKPNSITGLRKYLASGLIKGIGPVYAEKLVDAFGTDVLTVIDEDPDKLATVPGIGVGRVEKIKTAWRDQKEISKVMVFLQERNISTAYSIKIYKKYGQESIAIMHENPYRLAEDIWGIGFKTADTIAQNLGIEKNSLQRVTSGILFALTQALNQGHLYCELTDLKNKTCELLELALDEVAHTIKTALHNLYTEDKIKLITHEEKHFVGSRSAYVTEKGVASKIKKLQEYPSPCEFDIDTIYTKIRTPQQQNDIELNEEQQKGIISCLQNKVSIITGGPGTGKTTLIKKLLQILDQENVLYKLAAPTGRAAKRITEGTGRPATTIHRLLDFDFTTYSFKHNENNALQLTYLIIDEASMIDIFLGYSIIRALPAHAHLLLIGDVDQLPSVGAGNFLKDLIASESVSCVSLKQIFRQARDSMIITNAHRINNGEFPQSATTTGRRDFYFIKEENPENLPDHLQKIYQSGLAKRTIARHDSVVLTPMNRGAAGTQKINYDLQQFLNGEHTDKQLLYRGTTFKCNDRVMQICNNYDKKVFNGDIGTITDVDLHEKTMLVSYNNRIVEYEMAELDELVLAYAITIHKSQGSEYPTVIIPIFMQHFTLLQRNLIYTAITRAKKLCIFIGQPKAIGMAIRNNSSIKRCTFLTEFLTTDLACR